MNVATMVFAVAIGLGLAPAAMGGAVNDTASTPGRTAPPGARTPPVALVGGTVHTVSGPTIPNGTVVIENGRIAAVGAGLAAPAGATIVSCAGRDVYPGMISPNTLLGLIEVNSVEGTLDYEETGPINPDVRAATAINPESELLPVTRANGVTTALVSPRGGLISGIAALIHLDGWTAADMTVLDPAGLFVAWPGTPPRRFGGGPTPAPDPAEREQQIATIRKAFDDARAYSGARHAERSPGVPRHDRDLKWDALAMAVRGEIPVLFRVTTLAQIHAVLHFVDEQKLPRVVLVDANDAWRVADVLRDRQIAVITAPTGAVPRRRYDAYDEAYALPGRLAAAGVTYCIGDGGSAMEAANSRNLPYEAAMASAFGLPRDEALKAVTLYPAQILGMGDRLGSIDVGKIADLIVTDGDPLELTTHIEQVWIAGRATSLETRQTRLFHKYDARPRGTKARPR